MRQTVDEFNPAAEPTPPPQALSPVGQQRYNHAIESIQMAESLLNRRLVPPGDALVGEFLSIATMQLQMVNKELVQEVRKA